MTNCGHARCHGSAMEPSIDIGFAGADAAAAPLLVLVLADCSVAEHGHELVMLLL